MKTFAILSDMREVLLPTPVVSWNGRFYDYEALVKGLNSDMKKNALIHSATWALLELEEERDSDRAENSEYWVEVPATPLLNALEALKYCERYGDRHPEADGWRFYEKEIKDPLTFGVLGCRNQSGRPEYYYYEA